VPPVPDLVSTFSSVPQFEGVCSPVHSIYPTLSSSACLWLPLFLFGSCTKHASIRAPAHFHFTLCRLSNRVTHVTYRSIGIGFFGCYAALHKGCSAKWPRMTARFRSKSKCLNT
jgi:hypothetical protein